MSKRTSGSIRKLPSGRYQARVRDVGAGKLVPLGTYATKQEADNALAEARTSQARGGFVRPADGRMILATWANDEWYPTTVGLRPKTRALYRYLLDKHVLPTLGTVPLASIDVQVIKRWLARLSDAGLSASTRSKAYRLLSQMLSVAVEAERLAKNPCTIKAAGREPTPDARCPSATEVLRMAEAIDKRYRAMVLLAGFGGLRIGECAGLRRQDVDLKAGTVRVSVQVTELSDGRLELQPPKTAAGLRVVHLPSIAVTALKEHLEAPSPVDAWLFPNPKGGPLRSNNFRSRYWRPATESAELPGLRFHDLRHGAATMAAQAGATTKELMTRIGHASPQAALRYQHALEGRDLEIAKGIDAMLKPKRAKRISTRSRPHRGTVANRCGTPVARDPITDLGH